eukprot:104850_1
MLPLLSLEALCDTVHHAQSYKDIELLMRMLPLEAVKTAMVDIIENLEKEKAHKVACNWLSIDAIFSADLMQHIISFTDSLNIKYVNAAWYGYWKTCNTIQYKRQQSIINDRYKRLRVNLKSTSKLRNVWIFHKSRKHLTAEEKDAGYMGPYNALAEFENDPAAQRQFSDGDVVIFHNGVWKDEFRHDPWLTILSHDVQIIGIGSNVTMIIKAVQYPVTLTKHVYIENMQIYCYDGINIGSYPDDYTDDGLSGHLSLEKCHMVCNIKAVKGTLTARRCHFDKSNVRVEIGSGDDHSIIGCVFTGVGPPCISILPSTPIYPIDTSKKPIGTGVQCIGNTFRNNIGIPIVVARNRPSKLEAENPTKLHISGNRLEGYNGVNTKAIDSANTKHQLVTYNSLGDRVVMT